jgi:phosphatidylserine/phosphatidylglycerophosphate/cardiolipin synthase-like enzyme
MTPQQMEQALRRTLEDTRLSGGEKRALEAVLTDGGADEQQRGAYRHQAFDLARDTLADPRARQVLDWLEEVVKVLQRREPDGGTAASDACFSPGHDCPARIAGLFHRARQRVDVCVFTITDDRIADALLAAHRRGVALRIITDNDKAFDPGSDVDDLIAAGVPVRIDRTPYHMHHKFAIFDGDQLLNGSYNWTRGAAEHNHENFTITSDRRLVAAFAQTFERLWQELGRQKGR